MEIERQSVATAGEFDGFSKDGLYLVCSGEMTIMTAEADYKTLHDFFSSEREILMDMSGITEFDSSGLQHLLALRKSCDALKRPCAITTPSEAVTDVLDIYNVKHLQDLHDELEG